MRQLRNIFLLLLLGLPMWTWADGCFELVNYYSSRPTNYTTRGGDGWMATSAAVEPTSSMYFYSSYDYVMLTGGNKNTAPGQLEVRIMPDKGVDTLTFLIAKPCISDRYSGAGVYVYADNELVYSQLVVAYGLSYREVQVPVNKDCQSLRIVVTNYYTNTTKEHNNRIAFAHFCWTDNKKQQPSEDPEHPGQDPEHPLPSQKHDTVEYVAQACYDQVPFVWNGIECVKTDDYYYTTTNSKGDDSTTVLHFTVLPQPTYRTEQEELRVGDRMMWHNQLFAPTAAGDFTYKDTVWNTTTGCIAYIYTLNLHVLPSPQEEYECKPMVTMRRDTAICEGDSFDWFGTQISRAGKYTYTISSSHSATCDSIRYQLNVGYKQGYATEETKKVNPTSLPVLWNGQECMTAGDYVFRGTTVDGCDSVVTLHLQVVEPPVVDTDCPEPQHIAIDTALCEGQVLVWRDLMTDVPGTYYDTILSRRPPFCDSVYLSLTMQYKPLVFRADTLNLCESEMPYMWYRQIIVQSGTVVCIVSDSTGCDSVLALTVQVRHPDRIHIDRRVCHSQLPYIWHGKVCNGSGTYVDTLTNQWGCDSIITLHLEADTYSASDTTAWCCESDLPFVWHEQSLTESGTVSWTTTNSVGCDSVVALHLHVSPPAREEVVDTAVCAGTDFVWNGKTYSTEGTYLDTLRTQQSQCDSVYYTLHLSYIQPTESLTVATICKGEEYVWHGQTFRTTTEITETLTNAAGCDSVCTLRLIVRPYPQGKESHTICFGDSVLVHDRWLKETGTYIDTLKGAGHYGCDSICRVSVRVTPRPEVHKKAVRLFPEETPYIWRGHTISEDVLLTDTVTNGSTGCDSVYYILDLHILGACEPKPIMRQIERK